MAKTEIQWTDYTDNITTGCDDASPGCKKCYARTMSWRNQHNPKLGNKYAGTVQQAGHKTAWTGKINLHPDVIEKMLSRKHRKDKKQQKVFVNSMSDIFHQDVPFEFIDKFMAAAAVTPYVIYQLLTKREGRMVEYYSGIDLLIRWRKALQLMDHAETIDAFLPDLYPLPNVWQGVSVEDQKRADMRIPELLKVPAAVRWLSCEPLLEAVDLTPTLSKGEGGTDDVHWVVVGAESGHGARECKIEWIESIVAQCQAAGVPVFVKQLGKTIAKELGLKDSHGGDMREWPDSLNHLKIREFPEIKPTKP
jgi:protein gp37